MLRLQIETIRIRKADKKMTFGQKFKTERIRCNMTQQQVADALNINLRMITRYEKDESFPRTRDAYRRIADLFGCGVNYLLTDDAETESGRVSRADAGRYEAQKLISSMSGLFAGGDLSESDKDAVMQAIEKIYWESRRRYNEGAGKENKNDASPDAQDGGAAAESEDQTDGGVSDAAAENTNN